MKKIFKLVSFIFICLLILPLCGWQQGGFTYQQNQIYPLGGLGFPSLPSAYIVPIPATTLGNGENDVYTVPTGKRATIALSLTNIGLGTVNTTQQIKNGGNYYQINALAANNTNTQSQFAIPFNTYPILEAGESFSILTSAANLQLYGYAIVFDTAEPLSSPKLLTLASGNNTVYTCPVGKVSFFLNLAGTNTNLRIFNGTATTRTYVWNAVPAGGSVGTTNQLQAVAFTTLTLVASNQTASVAGLAATGFLSLNSDSSTAGQVAWVGTMIELPVR